MQHLLPVTQHKVHIIVKEFLQYEHKRCDNLLYEVFTQLHSLHCVVTLLHVCTGVHGLASSSHTRPHACPHAGSQVRVHPQQTVEVMGAKVATWHDPTPWPCCC